MAELSAAAEPLFQRRNTIAVLDDIDDRMVNHIRHSIKYPINDINHQSQVASNEPSSGKRRQGGFITSDDSPSKQAEGVINNDPPKRKSFLQQASSINQIDHSIKKEIRRRNTTKFAESNDTFNEWIIDTETARRLSAKFAQGIRQLH